MLFSRISLVERNDRGKITNIELSNEDGHKILHIDKDDVVSASQSGANVWVDEESKQDLDGLSRFSLSADPNFPNRETSHKNSNEALHIYEDDEESKRDLDGYSVYSSEANPNSHADNYRRQVVSVSSQNGGENSVDEESKRDLDGYSVYSSVIDPNSHADSSRRQGLSVFSESSGNEQEGRTSLGLSCPSVSAEEDRQSVCESVHS